MSQSEVLSAALEDYLEEISRLAVKKGVARARDIARSLSVHKSTVTAALRSLAEKGYINYTPYEIITLTAKGQKTADQIVQRHEIIKRFLVDVLATDEKIAEQNACRMEHVIDRQVLDRLLNFADFVKSCPRGGNKWLKGFTYYCRDGIDGNRCEKCLELALEEFRKKINQSKNENNNTSGPGTSGHIKQKQQDERKNNMIPLAELKPKQKARIAKIGRAGPVTRRIIEMGVVKGTPIEVVKIAPLGDPIEVKIKGYNLSLRKEEASKITTELVE